MGIKRSKGSVKEAKKVASKKATSKKLTSKKATSKGVWILRDDGRRTC